jgi:hypothetical protein
MNNIMLDLETMSTAPDAAIVSIGAVKFDMWQVHDTTGRFSYTVSLQSSADAGLRIDPATVMWWLQQGWDARTALLSAPRQLVDVLEGFSNWIGQDTRIWGDGSDFDNVILANAYRACGIDQPWAHWNNRCYRTVKNMAPHIQIERTGTHHSAFDDAESQARHLIRIAHEIPQVAAML